MPADDDWFMSVHARGRFPGQVCEEDVEHVVGDKDAVVPQLVEMGIEDDFEEPLADNMEEDSPTEEYPHHCRPSLQAVRIIYGSKPAK